MASPIVQIKNGILVGDWGMVVKGYNRLSGERMKVPKNGKNVQVPATAREVPAHVRADIERPFVHAISQAIEALQDALDSDEHTPDPPAVEDEEEEEDGQEEEPSPFVEADIEKEEEVSAGPSVEDRAAEARAILRGERPMPDFTHVHGGTPATDENPELGRKCRTEPFRPGMGRNEFEDLRGLHRAESKVDRKLTRGLRPTQRRPAARKVKVTCFKCDQKFSVDPSLAPRTIQAEHGTEETTTYVCDECMRRSVA